MGIETTLPGDLAALDTEGIGEGEPIWDRMSKLIRSRRLVGSKSNLPRGKGDGVRQGQRDIAPS